MAQKQVLMCPPDYFGVYYDINAHMRRTLEKGRKVIPAIARKQWSALRDIYLKSEYEVLYIEPVLGMPDLVFTANAGLISEETVVIGQYAHNERRQETPVIQKWFGDNEYKVVTIPYFFEGHGDALFWKKILIGGYGLRSEDVGVMLAAEFVEKELVLLKMIDEDFYHLDTCFCPLGDKALFYPHAFDAASIRDLEKAGELIEVSAKDAYLFACNGVYLETGFGPKFIAHELSGKLRNTLEKLGCEIIDNRTTEFLLSGGSNRCMSLFL